jgi:hypothetical protein
MKNETQMATLIGLLDEAKDLSGQFSGGYSGNFFSAEEFHTALIESVDKLRNGDMSQLNELHFWFLPTSCWDDFIGMEGAFLANQISELLIEMIR